MKIKSNMKIKITTDAEIMPVDLVRCCNNKTIYDFIVELDAAVEDWDFTMKLHKHFARLAKVHAEEVVDTPETPDKANRIE